MIAVAAALGMSRPHLASFRYYYPLSHARRGSSARIGALFRQGRTPRVLLEKI